jgi:hypothetical protein
MKHTRVIIAGALMMALLAVPSLASAKPTGHRHACSVQHRFLGAGSHDHWWRGTAKNPADESLKTTTYRYGSGSCSRVAFGRWIQIMDQAFGHFPHSHGKFSAPGIRGTWRHIRTVQVPHTSVGSGAGSLGPTPYGWFSLRFSDLTGRLIGTGTAKLRLAC